MVSATTTSCDLHEHILEHGSGDMHRALACNGHLSESARTKLYRGDDAVVRARVAELTHNPGLVREALTHPSVQTQRAGASNPRADIHDLTRAAEKGNLRALLSPRIPEQTRAEAWTMPMAEAFCQARVGQGGRYLSLWSLVRWRAVICAAPWLGENSRDRWARGAREEYSAMVSCGYLDMDETQLGREVKKASPHSSFAVLALALKNPLSSHLRDWYCPPSGEGVRRAEPYSLGLAISAHGAQVYNPYGDSPGEQNPTGFVSPVCQLNTTWSSYTQHDLFGNGGNRMTQERHAAALIRDRRVVETVTALAEEWQGSLLDLLEAAGELVKDTTETAARRDRQHPPGRKELDSNART